ncbi:expressed unknown protein [Seminavis robusta]|uniref:Uncharacterized protein n=1 Tax=Seminavis robusta TaxID=568900 RepID=A0A9N8EGE2_9STRA|nr:expressed unknown protein [Seminavis robusta]|eukprot:Sro953_g224160.1 n/a (446) ;mRNA; r:2612-3949
MCLQPEDHGEIVPLTAELPMTIKDTEEGSPQKSPSASAGLCTTRYLLLVFLNVCIAVVVLYVNLVRTGPCGGVEKVKDFDEAGMEEPTAGTAVDNLSSSTFSEEDAAIEATTTTTPPQVNYVDYILGNKMTNVCLVQGSGLCSQIMNIMGQKILFGDKGRGFIVDDTHYNYRWKDGKTGVLHGFFTPQFPVLREGEWDSIIRPRFHTPPMGQVVGAVGMTGDYRDREQQMEVQWCPGEGYRGFFPPIYGTEGEEVYNRFAKETCDNFQFNDQAKQEIKAVMDENNIPDIRHTKSVAFHVRRGDKLIGESAAYPGSDYVDKLLEVAKRDKTRIDDCFITSDDYAAIDEIKQSLKEKKVRCKIHTVTKDTEHGSDFRRERNGPADYESTIEFLTEVSLMSDATYFIGTFNSNVGSVASLMRKCHYPDAPHYSNSYGVDRDVWYYRLH